MFRINRLLLCLLMISLISCSSSDKTEELKVAEIPTTDNDFAEGAEVVTPPSDSEWGRRAVVKDLDGHIVELVTKAT